MAFKGNLQTKKQSSPTLQGLTLDILFFTTAVDIIIPNKSLPKGERLVKRTGPLSLTLGCWGLILGSSLHFSCLLMLTPESNSTGSQRWDPAACAELWETCHWLLANCATCRDLDTVPGPDCCRHLGNGKWPTASSLCSHKFKQQK